MFVPLIFPMLVGYRQLDLTATAAAGYDHVWRQPEVIDDGSQLGTSARTEAAEIQVPGQVEPGPFRELEMVATGDVPDGEMVIIHHFVDLERLGLVRSDGNASIKKGDRVAAIYHYSSGDVVLTIPEKPGLFVIDVGPSEGGIGLDGERALLKVTLGDRERGLRV